MSDTQATHGRFDHLLGRPRRRTDPFRGAGTGGASPGFQRLRPLIGDHVSSGVALTSALLIGDRQIMTVADSVVRIASRGGTIAITPGARAAEFHHRRRRAECRGARGGRTAGHPRHLRRDPHHYAGTVFPRAVRRSGVAPGLGCREFKGRAPQARR
ncbi:hypothetical protein ACFQU2_17580 [Siccirubricoccus deserti]